VDKPALHAEIIDWFLTLLLWLDLPELRVVHACWHTPFMQSLSPHLHEGRYLTRKLMVPATDEPKNKAEKDNATPSVFKSVEALTKGIEIPLPAGHQFHDKYGHVRHRVRVRWWDKGATTYRSAAMLSPAERAALPDLPIQCMRGLNPSSSRRSLGVTGSPACRSCKPAGYGEIRLRVWAYESLRKGDWLAVSCKIQVLVRLFYAEKIPLKRRLIYILVRSE